MRTGKEGPLNKKTRALNSMECLLGLSGMNSLEHEVVTCWKRLERPVEALYALGSHYDVDWFGEVGTR